VFIGVSVCGMDMSVEAGTNDLLNIYHLYLAINSHHFCTLDGVTFLALNVS